MGHPSERPDYGKRPLLCRTIGQGPVIEVDRSAETPKNAPSPAVLRMIRHLPNFDGMLLRNHSALLLVSSLLLIGLTACGRPPRHNVVLVTFDTTRADHFRAYGNEGITTDVVDGLAADGVLFERAYSAVPVTAPSHSTILTGKYPPAHGVRDNGLFVLTESHMTLAEILKSEGYATAASVASFPLDSQFGLDQGFDLYDDHFTGSYENLLGHRIQAKSGIYFDERKAAQVNEAIFPWLEAHHEQPFFLWLHYFDPHHPLTPPSPYDQLYAQDLYKGEIAYADESLGTVVDRLRELGVWDDTILVMTSDHGEGLGEHNEMTHSTLTYNSTLHVPLVMRIPEGPKGRRVSSRVGTVDIMPTLLDLLGLDRPDDVQGQSLVPMIEDPAGDTTPRTLYAETLAPRFSHSLGELRVLFHRQFKYIFGPRPELYDIAADPQESRNLIADEDATAAGMHQRLEAFLAEHGVQDPEALMEVDESTRARLEALGYIQTEGGVPTVSESLDGSGTPPQDRVADINDVSTAKNFLHGNKPANALDIAMKLLRRDPDNPYYLQLKASAELQMDDLEQGLATMDEIRRRDPQGLPGEGLLLHAVSRLYYSNRIPEAIELLEDAQEVRPSPLGSWHLASLYQAVGRFDDEVAALEKSLEESAEFAPARVDLAARQAAEGRLDEARQEFEKALRDMPYYPKAHYNLATLHSQQGDLESAMRHFARAVELKPIYPKAQYALIVTALQLQRPDEASDHFRTLMATAPDSAEAKQALALLESAQ